MKIRICLFVGLMVTIGAAVLSAQNKYVGVKTCGMCHKTEKQGNQLAVWQGTKHAEAYKTLTGAKADSIAKARKLAKPAFESKECLECHVVGYGNEPSLVDAKFDFKDGVQCETCHGPGSGYKTIPVMKDKAKAVAAGLHEFKDEKAIEAFCRTCHNERSPMYKEFIFKERWEKIKHPRPKS
jgi:cytochrome c5